MEAGLAAGCLEGQGAVGLPAAPQQQDGLPQAPAQHQQAQRPPQVPFSLPQPPWVSCRRPFAAQVPFCHTKDQVQAGWCPTVPSSLPQPAWVRCGWAWAPQSPCCPTHAAWSGADGLVLSRGRLGAPPPKTPLSPLHTTWGGRTGWEMWSQSTCWPKSSDLAALQSQNGGHPQLTDKGSSMQQSEAWGAQA